MNVKFKYIILVMGLILFNLQLVSASDWTDTGFSHSGSSGLAIGLGVGVEVSSPRYLNAVNLTSTALATTAYLYRKGDASTDRILIESATVTGGAGGTAEFSGTTLLNTSTSYYEIILASGGSSYTRHYDTGYSFPGGDGNLAIWGGCNIDVVTDVSGGCNTGNTIYNFDSIETTLFVATPVMIIDDINLINNTYQNSSEMDIFLNISIEYTNALITTHLYKEGNTTQDIIGTNTQNVSHTKTDFIEGEYNIWTYSFNNETNVTSSNYTYIFDFTNPVLNDSLLETITVNDLQFNISDYITYSDDNLDTCTYTFNVTAYNCTQVINLTEIGRLNYTINVTDLAGNLNTTSNYFNFDFTVTINVLSDLDNGDDLITTPYIYLIGQSNTSNVVNSTSNPYTQLYSTLNEYNWTYNISDLGLEHATQDGTLNFVTSIKEYNVTLVANPFTLAFYSKNNTLYNVTNGTITDASTQTVLFSNTSIIYKEQDWDTGLVKVTFNEVNNSVFQTFEYINTYQEIINEQLYVFNDLNEFSDVGFFKVVDEFGQPIADATVTLKAITKNETDATFLISQYRIANQLVSTKTGYVSMFYEQNQAEVSYLLTVSAEGYGVKSQVFNPEIESIATFNEAKEIVLVTNTVTLSDGIGIYTTNSFFNTTESIGLSVFGGQYSQIYFKTQYYIDNVVDEWININDINNDGVHSTTLTEGTHFSNEVTTDITIYVRGDNDFNTTFTIPYDTPVEKVFTQLTSFTSDVETETVGFFALVILILVSLVVRYTMENSDGIATRVFLFGIVFWVVVTQNIAIFGYPALTIVGYYIMTLVIKAIYKEVEQ